MNGPDEAKAGPQTDSPQGKKHPASIQMVVRAWGYIPVVARKCSLHHALTVPLIWFAYSAWDESTQGTLELRRQANMDGDGVSRKTFICYTFV